MHERRCQVKIGTDEFKQIVILGKDNEVLAVISDKEIIEKKGVRVEMEPLA